MRQNIRIRDILRAIILTLHRKKREIMDTKFIESNPSIMMGKPVIAGTRIPVELILEKFAAGETIEELLESYPRLTRESVLAAFHFGVQTVKFTV